MPLWILTFFLGVLGITFCSKLPSCYFLFSVPLFLFVYWLFQPSSRFKLIFWHLLIFLLGFFWALIYSSWISCRNLPIELESKNLLVTGYIASLPVKKEGRASFEFETERISQKKQHTRLKLSWYGNVPALTAGNKWQLLVRLKRVHGTLNPGGFDLEKHLFIRRVRATGYVVTSDLNQILTTNCSSYPLTRFRQFLISKMEQALISHPLTAVIIALVTGAEDHISKEEWRVMRDTGTSYLVAISGLHIGLVASLFLLLVKFLWSFSACLPLILPSRFAGIIGGL